jgi:hypothetical protein
MLFIGTDVRAFPILGVPTRGALGPGGAERLVLRARGRPGVSAAARIQHQGAVDATGEACRWLLIPGWACECPDPDPTCPMDAGVDAGDAATEEDADEPGDAGGDASADGDAGEPGDGGADAGDAS